MGTVERGESNLSFNNIVRIAANLEVPLSSLFLDLEGKAKALAAQSPARKPVKSRKRAAAVDRTV